MRNALLYIFMVFSITCKAQSFGLEQESDSMFYLTCTKDAHIDRFKLSYPVLKWCTGDVDGDGIEDAMVMVVKTTRYDSRRLPRLFTFRQVNGKVRPLWLGSQLGGILEDFRYVNGKVITLQLMYEDRYIVMTHKWRKFGLGADSILVEDVSRDEALRIFNNNQSINQQ